MLTPRNIRVAFVAVVLTSGASAALNAQTNNDISVCTNQNNSKDRIIQSCTRLLELSDSSDRVKILALINRGGARLPQDPSLARVDLDQALKSYNKKFFSNYEPRLSASKANKFKGSGSPLTNIEWAEGFNHRGDVEADSFNFSAAIPYYKEAARINPWNDSYESSLGFCYRKRGAYADATRHLDRAVVLNPTSAYDRLQRGFIYRESGDPIKARIDFEEAVKLYSLRIANIQASSQTTGRPPQSLAIYYSRLGEAKLGIGDTDSAINSFNAAINIKPEYAIAFFGLGKTYIFIRNYELAVKNLNEAIRLDSKYAAAYAFRGQAYMESAQLRRVRNMPSESQKLDLAHAQDDLKKALYLDPSLVDAHDNFNKVNASLAQVNAEMTPTAVEKPLAPVSHAPPAGGQESRLQPSEVPPLPERRLGFSVGNRVYLKFSTPLNPKQGQLESPVHDAQLMRDILQKLRFEVTERENLTHDQYNAEYATFLTKIQPGDTVLIYFSGHGATIMGYNLFLPTDTPLLDPAISASELLSIGIRQDNLVRQAQEKGAKLVIVVSDACRNDPFAPAKQITIATATKALPKERDTLLKPTPVGGALMIYAAGQGQTALDGASADENSLFTKYLMPQLLVEKQDVVNGILNTRALVAQEAALAKEPDGSPHKQYPAYYDETLGGRIYLNGAPPSLMAELSGPNDVLVKSLPTAAAMSPSSEPTPVLAPQ
jgi:tetratricopeptide (TPR) repeat protein